MIEKTTNYEMFKKSSANRPISQTNLARIVSSIRSKNLLEFRPIIVNDRMEVIDGQHRLEAAKVVGVEIWYKIDKESQTEDILLLNLNQKNWDLGDFLNYYTSSDKEEYVKFDAFIKKENVDIRQGLRLLNVVRSHGFRNFKSGDFKFPEGFEMVNVMNSLSKYKAIISLISLQKIDGSKICARHKFKTALLEMLKNEDLDFDVFKEKIAVNLDKVRFCAGANEYLNMLTQIYNWKNRNPLPDLTRL